MPLASDGYKTSAVANDYDSAKGSLRKLNKLQAGQYPTKVAEQAVQTSATGANWVQLSAQAGATKITADNSTGTSLTFRRHGLTATFTFASGARIDLPCLANASEWEMQRTDVSGTQVTQKLLAYYTA